MHNSGLILFSVSLTQTKKKGLEFKQKIIEDVSVDNGLKTYIW